MMQRPEPFADASNRYKDLLELDGVPVANAMAKERPRRPVVCTSGAPLLLRVLRMESCPVQGGPAAQPLNTFAGFRSAAKAELQAQVAALGAEYTGDLVRGTTTYLVCRRLLDAFGSFKYRMALEW